MLHNLLHSIYSINLSDQSDLSDPSDLYTNTNKKTK
jgi:hypothetical protein